MKPTDEEIVVEPETETLVETEGDVQEVADKLPAYQQFDRERRKFQQFGDAIDFDGV